MYSTIDTPAHIAAYGIWVFTWSMMSQPEVAQDIIVVSDIGEQWSPKMEPPKIAPATSSILSPMFIAIGRQMTDIIAIVPIEVPVAKDRSMHSRKLSIGSSAGVSTPINTAVR